MENDNEIEELKELVRRNTLLAQDTNKLVHSMRRNQRWHTIFTIVWWLTVVGVSGALYYYYLQPYVEQILGLYNSTQNLGHQVTGFFGNYFGTSTKP